MINRAVWNRREPLAAVVGLLAVAAGCGGGDPSTTTVSAPGAPGVSAPAVGAPGEPSSFPPPTQRRTEDPTNRRRGGFVPLDNPVFLGADERPELDDDELILALEWEGETRAYPVSMLRYHHIVNDAVEGTPILVTY